MAEGRAVPEWPSPRGSTPTPGAAAGQAPFRGRQSPEPVLLSRRAAAPPVPSRVKTPWGQRAAEKAGHVCRGWALSLEPSAAGPQPPFPTGCRAASQVLASQSSPSCGPWGAAAAGGEAAGLGHSAGDGQGGVSGCPSPSTAPPWEGEGPAVGGTGRPRLPSPRLGPSVGDMALGGTHRVCDWGEPVFGLIIQKTVRLRTILSTPGRTEKSMVPPPQDSAWPPQFPEPRANVPGAAGSHGRHHPDVLDGQQAPGQGATSGGRRLSPRCQPGPRGTQVVLFCVPGSEGPRLALCCFTEGLQQPSAQGMLRPLAGREGPPCGSRGCSSGGDSGGGAGGQGWG